MRTRSLLLLAAAFLWSGTARAKGPAADTDQRAKRHEELSKDEASLNKLCATVAGWKLMGKSDAYAAMDIVKDKTAPADVRKKAIADLNKMDADSKGLTPEFRQQLHEDVEEVGTLCTSMRDDDKGLPALTGDGVALEKIAPEQWDAVEDELGALMLSYQGKNGHGDTSTTHYGNRYRGFNDGKGVMDQANANHQLAADTVLHLRPISSRGYLDKAIEAVTGEKHSDESRSDP
jgi:hypothetical protein